MRMRRIIAIGLFASVAGFSCGSDDGNNGNNGTNANNGTNGTNANNGAANNGAANNGAQQNNGGGGGGSCFHNCIAQGPLGDIQNFGCVAPSSDGSCAADAQSHCESLSWGTPAATEFVADCNACDESCAPDFYDCSAAACATDVN